MPLATSSGRHTDMALMVPDRWTDTFRPAECSALGGDPNSSNRNQKKKQRLTPRVSRSDALVDVS